MKYFWGIFTALLILTSTLNVGVACANEHAKVSITTVSQDVSNGSNTNHDSHECPMNCHGSGSHCHGLCYQHFSQNVNIESKEPGKLNISGEFQPPLDPDLQGHRKPPKHS